MTPRAACFLVTLAVFFLLLAGAATRYYLRAWRTSKNTWENLLGRLVVVDRAKIALIASDLIEVAGPAGESQAGTELEPSQIWDLLGGLHGLEDLAANCEVLIDLACYVQQWYPEALVVAEQLRLNAREIQWHLGRLQGAAEVGKLESAFPNYAQRAVATYYGMTQHVLALYELADLPGLGELQRAI